MATASIFEAKNHFSRIIKRVQEGETVVITSGRSKKEVAKIVPIAPIAKQRLGFMADPNFKLTDAFWEPMTDEECGYTEHDGDPLK